MMSGFDIQSAATWRKDRAWDPGVYFGTSKAEYTPETIGVSSGTATYTTNPCDIGNGLRNYCLHDVNAFEEIVPTAAILNRYLRAYRTALDFDSTRDFTEPFRRYYDGFRSLTLLVHIASTAASRYREPAKAERKNAAAISLLKRWLNEPMDDDSRESFAAVAESINEGRRGYRRVFP